MPSSPLIFDRGQIRLQQARAAAGIADHNFLIDWNMRQIIERLADIKRTYPRALLAGASVSPDLRDALKTAGHIDELIVADESAALKPDIVFDAEFWPEDIANMDLIVAPFLLHRVNDVPGVLIQMRRALKPDGLMMAAFPGGETLIELRQSFMAAEIAQRNGAQMRVHPFIDRQQAASLLQRGGYSLPVVDSERLTVTYDNVFRLMQDLRGMGETNSLTQRQRHLTGKNLMLEMARLYQSHFTEDDGRIRATFEMIFMTGWAPHESQQQPLRPGSAQTRLADALGSAEIGTGEKAG